MLTIQFVSYTEIEDLGSARRVKKLIDIVKESKVALLEGRLTKQEELDLIQIAMEESDKKFKGIELAVINPVKRSEDILKKVKHGFVNALLGDRAGFTVIGPGSVIKEIKKDPDKVQLFAKDSGKRKRR